MESPVFKLEKVVHSRSEEMQDFEGPLDLILFLLGKNKLEIQDISISLICGQYIAWLEDRQRSGSGQRVCDYGVPSGVSENTDAAVH